MVTVSGMLEFEMSRVMRKPVFGVYDTNRAVQP